MAMESDFRRYQLKSITPVDHYVCTLNDDLQKRAADELRETDKIRQQCIKAMRDWIMENPRIVKCRLDSRYLLKILRFKKFSIPMTQEILERQLLFREGLYGYDFYSNLNPHKKFVLEYLEKGLFMPFLKRDKTDRLTVYVRFSAIDPSTPNMGNVFLSLMSLILETLMEDEENQIRGLNFIADLTDTSLKQLLIFPIDVWIKLGVYFERVSLMRIKSIHFINAHPTITFLVKIFMKHVSQKLRDRLKLLSKNINQSGLVELDYLPIEYGGRMPLKTITDHWKGKILAKKEFYDNYNNIKLNYALYPKNYLDCSLDSLSTPLSLIDLNNNIKSDSFSFNNGMEMIGSFRKLEID